MRDDTSISESFRTSAIWDRQKYDDTYLDTPDKFDFADDDPRKKRKFVANSLSGNERNRLFMRTEKNFADVSLVSGVDNLSDGRAFAMFDYDNDGWLDIALMSLNAPRFKLFKNQFGTIYPENRAMRIKLIGGMTDAKPSKELSNRDAIGAIVKVTYQSGKKAMFQKQAGEGFGAQNSDFVRVGCGEGDSIQKLEVIWPSGKSSEVDSPDIDSVVTIRESGE